MNPSAPTRLLVPLVRRERPGQLGQVGFVGEEVSTLGGSSSGPKAAARLTGTVSPDRTPRGDVGQRLLLAADHVEQRRPRVQQPDDAIGRAAVEDAHAGPVRVVISPPRD